MAIWRSLAPNAGFNLKKEKKLTGAGGFLEFGISFSKVSFVRTALFYKQS